MNRAAQKSNKVGRVVMGFSRPILFENYLDVNFRRAIPPIIKPKDCPADCNILIILASLSYFRHSPSREISCKIMAMLTKMYITAKVLASARMVKNDEIIIKIVVKICDDMIQVFLLP